MFWIYFREKHVKSVWECRTWYFWWDWCGLWLAKKPIGHWKELLGVRTVLGVDLSVHGQMFCSSQIALSGLDAICLRGRGAWHSSIWWRPGQHTGCMLSPQNSWLSAWKSVKFIICSLMVWHYVRKVKQSKHAVRNCVAMHNVWKYWNTPLSGAYYVLGTLRSRDWHQVKSARMEHFIHSMLAAFLPVDNWIQIVILRFLAHFKEL